MNRFASGVYNSLRVQQRASSDVWSSVTDSPTLQKIILDAVVLTGLFLVNRLGIAGNLAFLGIALGYLARSRDGEFKAFVLVSLAPILNTLYVTNGGGVYTAGRFLVYGFILVALYVRYERVLWQSRYLNVLVLMFLYIVACFALAVIKGYFVQVSAFKLFSFGVGTGCSVLIAMRCRSMDSSTRYWILSVFTAIAVMGIVAWGLGQGYNGKSDMSLSRGFFNGPMYHSNTLGPMCAMIGVCSLAFAVSASQRLSMYCFALVAIFVAFIWLTKSRTALGAFVLGSLILMILSYVKARGRFMSPRQMALLKSTIITVMLVSTVGFAYDSVNEGRYLQKILSFVSKTEEVSSVDELRVGTILASRLDKYEAGWGNFLENPITGIGFGTATGPQFERSASLISAPIEKGFIVIAVLEETGVVGAFFFIVFVGAFLRALYQEGNIVGFVGLSVYLIVNCGETMFFSYGGHGAFGWALVMCSFVIGAPRVAQSHGRATWEYGSSRPSENHVPFGIRYRHVTEAQD